MQIAASIKVRTDVWVMAKIMRDFMYGKEQGKVDGTNPRQKQRHQSGKSSLNREISPDQPAGHADLDSLPRNIEPYPSVLTFPVTVQPGDSILLPDSLPLTPGPDSAMRESSYTT